MATYSTAPGQRWQPQRPKLRTNALSEIGYNSITAAADSDTSTSGDENDGITRANAEEDAASVVGVSIGWAQTHLASPATPAVEKAAAIAQSGGFFGSADIGTVTEDNEEASAVSSSQISPEEELEEDEVQGERRPKTSATTEASAPTLGVESSQAPETFSQPDPQDTAQSTIQDQSSKNPKRSRAGSVRHSISSLGDVLSKHRRGSSLSDMCRKLPSFLQSLSIPRLLPSFDNSPAPESEDGAKEKTEDLETPHAETTERIPPAELQADFRERPQMQQRRSTLGATPDAAHSPFRSTGRPSFDGLSPAPSLGDDFRWVDVCKQVNSRKKAIADTIDDLRLPSLPSLGNFTFGPSAKSKTASNRNTRVPMAQVDNKSKFTAEHVAHPQFYHALDGLKGDIVILGGYRGSVLKSAGPDARRLWVPLAVTMNLRKVNLEVGLDREDELTEESRVVPGKMLSHIGPIDISRRLLRRLRDCPNARNGTLRVHEWGWDWRLSPALTSEKFRRFLRDLPCNQPDAGANTKGAIVIAHSLGGLITRHAINREPGLFSKVIYAGVPQHAVNVLGPLRHGDDVALNSRVLTAQVNFTIRTSFALLPLSGQCFYDADTKEELPVDFFNVEHWKEYKFSPVIARPLPNVEAPGTSGRNSIVDSVAGMLSVKAARTAEKADAAASGRPAGLAPHMNEGHDTDATADPKDPRDPKLAVTIPYDKALSYLERTLAETKEFLEELAYKPELEEVYPRLAVIYGKNIPTCKGAKVDGREGIKRVDAYDNLLFGSGDGVVLAKASMLPEGYKSVRKGIVLSERGHVSLLSDLDAVGKCLSALYHTKSARTRREPTIKHPEAKESGF